MVETPPAKPLTRNERVAIIRKHHESLFAKLGIPNAFFGCKSITERSGAQFTLPIGKIGFFESEVKTADFYFEITDFTPEIKDPSRQLYVLKFDPHYNNSPKYQLVENTPTGKPMYFIDPADFVKVNWPIDAPAVNEDEFLIPTKKEDFSQDQLTARDMICVQLRIPDSNKQWINDLISKAL